MVWVKKIVVVVLVGIQFIPTKYNQSEETLSSNFAKNYNAPKDIQHLLKVSCYDCHSNNTNYPWYNKIQPVSWFLEHHIKEGKQELNFNEFGNYSKRKQRHKLKAIRDQIKDDEMPLTSYTLIHKDAKLSEKEKKNLIEWINELKKKNDL